ncbi:MAG: CHRD domain-containing protein [Sphingomonas sp.]
MVRSQVGAFPPGIGTVDRSAILATPSDYYFNVHTAAFPKGALRGQLGR